MIVYIDKDFKSVINYQSLCKKKLAFFNKGQTSSVVYKYGNKYLVKRIQLYPNKARAINEVTMTKKIAEMVKQRSVPELFVECMLIFKCEKHYYILMKRYSDKKDVYLYTKPQKSMFLPVFKSIILQLMIATWHMNHTIGYYHDDLCHYGNHSKTWLKKHKNYSKTWLKNFVLLDTVKKTRGFKLGKNTIRIKTYGKTIKLIDFELARVIGSDKKIHGEKDTRVETLYRNTSLGKLPWTSEIISILYCQLGDYYPKKIVADKLSRYYKKIQANSMKQYDTMIIQDFQKNYHRIIKLFTTNLKK
jgi:hypothetical protein